ncbi:MAG: type II secretion system protein GspC [Deltaproteobacteria bacterium]|nr:MAG: type II secretion system protein GspC [Deltaproteobacteria bacterium]
MENFIDNLKRYFWIINILLITLCAYFASQIFTDYLCRKLRVTPKVSLSSAKVATVPEVSPQRDLSFYSVITERNIFNSRASEMMAEAGIAALSGPVVESSLKATLLGTVASQFTEFSFAVIQDSVSQQVGIYRVGDLILNEAKVIVIEPKRVIIIRNGKQESLLVFEKEEQIVSSKPSAPAPPGEVTVRQVEENRYEIDRREFEASTDNLAELMTQARVVPNMKGGKVKGYKIFAIKPNSLYAKIGLKNGDVIERVNELQISSPEQALEIFQQLKNESHFQIDLLRRGRKESITYAVR